MNSLQFFHHTKIGERLYQIVESYAPCRDPGFDNGSIFNIYVVLGSRKIAVIDTGLGACDGLREYIETAICPGTEKPMIAILGHTHPDHCGGAALFDEIYLPQGEVPDLEWNTDIQRRMSDLFLFANYDEEVISYCREHYVKGRIGEHCDFATFRDGDLFDLGDVKLRAVELPGHSAGSMVLWNEEEKWACGSDSVQILNGYRGGLADLKGYRKSLERFLRMMPEDIRIYSGHDRVVHDKSTLYLMREALDDVILNRNLTHDIPKPPRFAMTKPGPRMMIHLFGHLRVQYSSEIWGNYRTGTEMTAEELLALLGL